MFRYLHTSDFAVGVDTDHNFNSTAESLVFSSHSHAGLVVCDIAVIYAVYQLAVVFCKAVAVRKNFHSRFISGFLLIGDDGRI